MDTAAFIAITNVIGTAAFAATGAIVAADHDMDIFGVNILAIVTACGGGLLRDLIIGHIPPAMFQDPLYVAISALTANFIFAIMVVRAKRPSTILYWAKRMWWNMILTWCDAIGLAAFTVIGVYIGMDATPEPNFFLAATLGVVTAVGGGLLRDLFAMRKPAILTVDIYAVASLVGALCMIAIFGVVGMHDVAIFVGFSVTLVVRLISFYLKWSLPHIGDAERADGRRA